MKKKTLALVILVPLLATTQMVAELVRIPPLNGRTPIVYEHYQVLNRGYHTGCAAPDIVDSPQSQKVICHTGDFASITVKRVLVYLAAYIEDESSFLEVSLPTGKTGYIKLSVNPYGAVVLSRDVREWATEELRLSTSK